MSNLKMIELFAGIRALSLASKWIGGFETVQAVEINPYCNQKLPDNGVSHGIPDRLAGLSAYGNAIVPQVAIAPLLRVKYLAELINK